MKTFIAAIALTIALPAAAHAQNAQAGENHAQHQGMDYGKEQKDCAMNCCKAKEAKKMACCDKPDQKGDDAHAGHDMKH